MKICAISDLHGQLDFDINECDILCICGDIVPLDIQRPPRSPYNFETQCLSTEDFVLNNLYNQILKENRERWRNANIEWLNEVFIPWCERQPAKKIFLVGGNHDFFLESEGKENLNENIFRDTIVTYLEDDLVEYEELMIYGTPWCHQFGRWAFMANDRSLGRKFRNIPEDVDILLTHDAPFGRNDRLLESEFHYSKGHIGNKPMVNRLKRLKNPPKYHFTGHLHSCDHYPVEYDKTTTVCVSLLNEKYNMSYKPFYVTF